MFNKPTSGVKLDFSYQIFGLTTIGMSTSMFICMSMAELGKQLTLLIARERERERKREYFNRKIVLN